MLYINNNNTNPYFNLATEEYLLKNFTDNCFMLWRNEPCIVVGKNQNTLSEINYDYIKENKIPVVRRLSGGGAVFHDLGNINFTFISDNDSESFLNFKKFTQPIVTILEKLEVKAEFSGRNDLVIDGRKFSGNAQYNYKNRILHHGTLLFSSNMTDLTSALNVKPTKFQGKSVKSVISRVTNISEHLKSPLSIYDFKELVMNHILQSFENTGFYGFNTRDLESIDQMVKEKYDTWEWNFGGSPNYSFSKEKRFEGGSVEFNLNVEKGIIKNIKLYGDFFGKCDVSEIENSLIGINHSEAAIKLVLSSFNLSDYFLNISEKQLLEGLL
jgi:lipoate---protein ligase